MMGKRTAIIGKSIPMLLASIACSSLLLLAGCDSQTNPSADSQKVENAADLSLFEGCYTVSHDEPAQIKVSEQNGAWIMQMKEPASAKRVWDDPEALEIIQNTDIPKFFSIDPDNVDVVIGRPDRVLVLAHVKTAYANIDPLLDSEYLAYIYRGANTIYRVECDDVNTDILANPHANIVIDNVNKSL